MKLTAKQISNNKKIFKKVSNLLTGNNFQTALYIAFKILRNTIMVAMEDGIISLSYMKELLEPLRKLEYLSGFDDENFNCDDPNCSNCKKLKNQEGKILYFEDCKTKH